MADVNWLAIKNEYINTNISYRKLAEKYGVSFNTLKDKAVKENWKSLRDAQHNKITTTTQQKTAEKIASKEADRIARIVSLADRLADKLEQAIDQADQYVVKNSKKMTMITYNSENLPVMNITSEKVELKQASGIIDKAGLKKLSTALKDIKDIQTTENDDSQLEKLDEILNKMGGEI